MSRPLCAAHNPASAAPGAPAGNRNARTHGFYAAGEPEPATIAVVIAGLRSTASFAVAAKQRTLSGYIDARLANGSAMPADVARLLALHGQNASWLGRLLRDQAALGGDDPGPIGRGSPGREPAEHGCLPPADPLFAQGGREGRKSVRGTRTKSRAQHAATGIMTGEGASGSESRTSFQVRCTSEDTTLVSVWRA